MTVHGGLSFEDWRKFREAKRQVRTFSVLFVPFRKAMIEISLKMEGFNQAVIRAAKAVSERNPE